MRRFLVALALALSIPASASTYTVDDTGDAPDFNPGDDVCSTAAVGGVCTLRAAIMESNAHAGPDEIEFDVAGTISPATQYPSVDDTLTIEGRGAPGYTNAPVVKLDGAFSVAVGLHFDTGSDESELIALEISGFSIAGVLVDSDELSIRQNYLGPVTGGTPNGDGLQLNGNGSTVGGADDGGNVISGNQAYGILVTGTNHVISDNFIGTDAAGTSDLANGDDGISISGGATGVTIGSATEGEENVISGNFDVGVSIDDGSGNTIAGNYIGLDVTGTAAIPNFIGVEVNAAGNVIGTADGGNVISGNDDDGIDINADDTVVHNNLIGPDATGTVGIGNFAFGIAAFVVSNVDVGGMGANEGNVISYNGGGGIFFLEVDDTRIVNNIVGLDAAGTNILGNGFEGILLFDSYNVSVGSNVVSGNSGGGIVDAGGVENIIELNRVGTTADGSTAAGNLDTGIELFATLDTIVRSNVASANGGHGIETTFGSTGAVIHSNIAGLSADLSTPLGNTLDGINVCDGASDTVVGSVALGGNIISANLENGIGVEATALTNNTWAANSIYDNGLLGIDIAIDGVTPNDPDDPDVGPNNFQNYPELVSAVTTPSASQVRGTIDTVPAAAFTIHFYSSPAADPSGFGEGRTYLGATSGTADANGDASFVFTGPALTVGHVVTATATTADGTSEFSGAEAVATAPAISFSSATYGVAEAGVTATITVIRTGDLDAISTVQYATSNDSATAGTDYTATSGTLTFAPGDDTETFTVTIANDGSDEPDEIIDLTLSSPTAATLAAPATAELTISDDDDPPQLSIDDVSLDEGDGGTTAFTFDVTLSVASGFTVTVDYATGIGTASAGSDYTAVSATTLTFDPGETTQSVTINVSGDVLFEDDETFFVNLTNATNASFADNQGLGTIQNDENEPAVSIADDAATEGDAVVFTVTLSGPREDDVTVNYATANDGATAGSDYTAQSAVATITAGTTSTTISVPTTEDALFESDETFFVNLSGAANIVDAQGIGTIDDDDASPGISIDDEAASEGNSVVFTVTLAAAAGTDVPVNYATANGSATAGDYTAQSGVATITAGNTTTTISVPTTEDGVFESNETFVVNLSGAANISDNQGEGTIQNDDASPGISIDDETASEGNSVVFTVTLSAAAGTDITVNYATANGSATAGDYTAHSGVATITAGNTSTTISVPTTEDGVFESDETFVVNLSGAANITDNQGQGTIDDDDGSPAISIDDGAASEGNAVVFTVTLAAAAGTDVTVNYATANGTATAPGDYTAQSGVATITAGTTSTTISVPTTEDGVFESDETFVVNLSGAANITHNQGQGTIQNDDGSPGMSIDDEAASEGNAVVFTVTLAAAAGTDVTVNYATANGTATAPGDYTAQSGVATITAGNTSTTISIPTTEDGVFESDETFVVNLSGAANITDSQGQATIEDDDGSPAISIDDEAASEGNAVVFTVTLSAAAGTDVNVNYATGNGTATAGDYTAQSGVATITAGNTSTTISVPTTEDALFESDETFVVNLSGAANIADNQGQGTIENDDAAPGISIDDETASEGNAVVFTVTLAAAAGTDVTVNYATANGTATAPGDYTAQSGVATITAGTTSTTITVPTTEDALFEANETFVVNLSGAANITDNQGQGTIENDDASPGISIDDEAAFEGNAVVFTVTLAAAAGTDITVNYGTANGTATAPGDYTAQSGVATITAGTTSTTITVATTEDGAFEADETFFVNLSGAANITDNQGQGTIEDDEGEPAISIGDGAAVEGEGVVFTVTLSAPAGDDVTVNYATADDTATAGSDYTAQSGVATITAGTTSTTITVATTEDALFESDETFFVNLSGAANIAGAQGTGTIENDDAMPVVSLGQVSLAEGHAGTTDFDFPLILSAAAGVDVTVDYTTTDGTADAGSDYTAESGSVVIPAGEKTAVITIAVTGDTFHEPNETFLVTLTGATNASISADKDERTGTILNDDGGSPTVSIGHAGELETDLGTTTFEFTLFLSKPSGEDVQVLFETNDGTATAGSDYTAASGTAIIPAGAVTGTIVVTVHGDQLFEANESFEVRLLGATNAQVPPFGAQGIGTILNDDDAPAVSIDDVTLDEGDDGTTNFVFTLTLSAAAGTDVTVDYSTVNATATAGSDYTAQASVATIPAGSTSTTITVPVSGDVAVETDETFLVRVDGTNATVGDGEGTGTILNDDAGPTADVSITKTTNVTTFTPGQQITYTLTVTNDGPLAATAITVTDVLAAGASLVSASGDGATCTGTATVTCTIPALADDATVTIALVIVATGDAPISNTATVSAAAPADGAPGNNAATAVIGPAAVIGAEVPTLSEWALIALALALAAVALRRS